MNDSDVEAILISQLAASRGVTQDEVLLELERSGSIDSLEGVELIIEAERTFGISIKDRELSSAVCQSIPRLVALVQSKRASSCGAKGDAGR